MGGRGLGARRGRRRRLRRGQPADRAAGDMPEYHSEGVFFTQGQPWWTTLPFGVAHEGRGRRRCTRRGSGSGTSSSAPRRTRVAIVQGVLLAPLGGAADLAAGRRLFGPAVGLGAAAWSPSCRSSGSTTACSTRRRSRSPRRCCSPCTVPRAERRPPGLAVAVGVVAGVGILIRPTLGLPVRRRPRRLGAGGRLERGLALTALAVAVGALVLPWTIRNYVVADGA